ncbi:DUF7286 family protein [Halobellus sp. EA9]|uniref:DUF7286 family protein n=1 Tax=Halobellus sp. EA9 TaxID=3421647 RepID=UPI003EB802CE
MRFADDDRARVPFALLGVLLLVGSSTFAASLATPGPEPIDRAADVAADRVEGEVTAAVRTAVRDAARAAARDPVTVAADTPAGRALGTEDPFRRSLRLRIFAAAREAVGPIEHRRGESVAHASFGAGVEDVEGALSRVSVAGRDDGTELRATVRGVAVTVKRNGRVLDSYRTNRTVTVAVPVLALHDRTEAFQARLDADPIAAPGLARRLTVGVTAMAQARGLGQYAGLPISNVVGNRHVALSTNAGLLDAQRASFGHADPEAAAGVRAATLRTGVTDVLGSRTDPRVVAAVTGQLPDPNDAERADAASRPGALPATRTITVGVNDTADEAFVALLRGTDGPSLDSIRRESYRASVSVDADARLVRNGRRPSPRAPGENWTLAYSDVDTSVSIRGGGRSTAVVSAGHRAHRLYAATRRVVERHTVQRTWVKSNATPRTTSASWRDAHRVRVTATGRLGDACGPDRAVDPLFRTGGALGGPNLRGGSSVARDLVAELGGPDAVARRTVTGGRTNARTRFTGDRPDDLSAWVYADVAALRERVRRLSVEVAASDAATGQRNGAARLANRVRSRRAALLNAPGRYDGVADRARIAARAAYLDLVLARLDERAGRTGKQNAGIGRALAAKGISAARANDLADLTPEAPSRRFALGSGSGARGRTAFVPDGDPAYLAPAPVEGPLVDGVDDDERYVGLAVRNHNVFAVPYGDAADLVTRTLFGDPGRVSLHAAGQSLVAADRTLAAHPNATLRARTDHLRSRVAQSMDHIRKRATRTLARESSLSRRETETVVRRAFAQWDGPGERAVAATDGSLAAAVASAAIEEGAARENDGSRRVAEDRIRTALRVDLRDAATSADVRVSQAAVEDAVSAIRGLLREEARARAGAATERAIARASNGTVGGIPAGLPILPTLNPWVATANVWVVESRGAYGRFAVTTDSGATTYVRDGSSVVFDVDGDGEPEVLGRNERIGFRVRTVAVVAVPAGKLGVGDTDGNVDERSVAWAGPAPGPRCVTPTGRCPRE